MTLAEWLLEQIAADEADAPRVMKSVTFTAGDGYLSTGFDSMEARVLAECAAKRAIVALATSLIGDADDPVIGHDLLRLLAQPYADRAGYRDEWRP